MIKRYAVLCSLVIALPLLAAAEAPGPVAKPVRDFTAATDPTPQPAFQTVWSVGLNTPPLVSFFAANLRLAWRTGIIGDYPLIFAIYPDGTVLFSKDTIIGGHPYYRTVLSAEEIESVRATLDGIGTRSNVNTPYLPMPYPDVYHTAAIVDGSKRTRLRTWHLFAESAGELLGTSKGFVAAEGRCFADIASSQPEHFLKYRQAWQSILDLRLIFDIPEAVEIPQLETDLAVTTFSGEYDSESNFHERRKSRIHMATTGDGVKIEQLRSKYSVVPPITSSQPCNR